MQTWKGLPLNDTRCCWGRGCKQHAETLFGCSRGPRHCAVTGATAVEWLASMHATDKVVILLGGRVPAVIDKAAMRAGAGPIPCD